MSANPFGALEFTELYTNDLTTYENWVTESAYIVWFGEWMNSVECLRLGSALQFSELHFTFPRDFPALERIDGGAFRFVAPGSALNEVEKICEDIDAFATITLGQRHILFEMGETELICRRLEGEFLDYKNAIPRRNPISVTVDTKAMLESLDRVSVVISEKLKSPVRCIFEQDRVLLSAKTANGDAKDVCRIVGDGQGLEIGFNNRYLMDALRFAPADELKLELNTGISPAILVPTDGEESFLYMVLPVRLKAQ